MIVVAKLTILLTLVCALLVLVMKSWCKNNPLDAMFENYPVWIYVSVLLIYLDIICVFISVAWVLFCYW